MATNKTSNKQRSLSTALIPTTDPAAFPETPHVGLTAPSSLPLLACEAKPIPIRLIPIQVVEEILGVKRTFITERVATKEMPLPVKLGSSRRAAVRWFEHEILEYVMQLATQRGGK